LQRISRAFTRSVKHFLSISNLQSKISNFRASRFAVALPPTPRYSPALHGELEEKRDAFGGGEIAARGLRVFGGGDGMLAKPLLTHILDDEALTRGLGDPEARVRQADRFRALGAHGDSVVMSSLPGHRTLYPLMVL
jgi:hypothetical protein